MKVRACSVPTHTPAQHSGSIGMARFVIVSMNRRWRGPASGIIATSLARAEKSAAGQIVLAAFYWLLLVAFPVVGEPFLERGGFG
jgi:hypothetical protein